MTKYRVLWFDDEHQTLEAIFEDALENDIELIAFSNSIDGLTELEQNHKLYHAIIVDGLFFTTSDRVEGDVDNDAFKEVGLKMRDLKTKGVVIPWFIYSGQPSFLKEKNDYVKILADSDFAGGKVFDKNRDKDFTELCEAIKTSAENVDAVRLRTIYREPFEAFGINLLQKNNENLLLQVLAASQKDSCGKEQYQALRDLFEEILIDLVQHRIIPNELLNQHGKPNQQAGVWYLNGKGYRTPDNRYLKVKDPLPDHLSKGLQYFKDITNALSHTYDEKHTIYAFRSAVNLLCELLIWYKDYIRAKGY